MCCPLETATVGRCKVAQKSRDTTGNVLYMECHETCAQPATYTQSQSMYIETVLFELPALPD